jgi:hypothetical protein
VHPALAATSAMPLPMMPDPITPTLLIVMLKLYRRPVVAKFVGAGKLEG